MPDLKVKVYCALTEGADFEGGPFKEIMTSVPEGESLLELARRLSLKERVLGDTLFDEENRMIHSYVAVILNGRLVNPYEHTQIRLRDGDEVMFLPIYDGG